MDQETDPPGARNLVLGCGFTTVVAATALFYLSIFNLGSYVAGLFLVAAVLVALLNANLVLSASPPGRGVLAAGRVLLWIRFAFAIRSYWKTRTSTLSTYQPR